MDQYSKRWRWRIGQALLIGLGLAFMLAVWAIYSVITATHGSSSSDAHNYPAASTDAPEPSSVVAASDPPEVNDQKQVVRALTMRFAKLYLSHKNGETYANKRVALHQIVTSDFEQHRLSEDGPFPPIIGTAQEETSAEILTDTLDGYVYLNDGEAEQLALVKITRVQKGGDSVSVVIKPELFRVTLVRTLGGWKVQDAQFDPRP